MSTDLSALSASVGQRFRDLFADGADFLGPVGVTLVNRALKSPSVAGQRKIEELAGTLVLADLAGRGQVLIAGAEVLREVPFTGNITDYEPVRQIFCGAYRRISETGGDPGAFRNLISLPENGGPGEPDKRAVKARAAGQLLHPPTKSSAAQATGGNHHVWNTCTEVLELYLMWAFGGNFRWSIAKIDAEIAAGAAILRNLRALP